MDKKPTTIKNDTYRPCADCGSAVRLNSPKYNYPIHKDPPPLCYRCYMQRMNEVERQVGHYKVTPDGTGTY